MTNETGRLTAIQVRSSKRFHQGSALPRAPVDCLTNHGVGLPATAGMSELSSDFNFVATYFRIRQRLTGISRLATKPSPIRSERGDSVDATALGKISFCHFQCEYFTANTVQNYQTNPMRVFDDAEVSWSEEDKKQIRLRN
jgi:hypothetical protein